MKFDKEKRDKINKLKKEIANLSDEAHMNINEDKTKVQVRLDELKGMPQDILKKLAKVSGKPNLRWVTLSKTQVIPALKFIEDEKVRKKLKFAMDNQCKEKNVPILEQLISKR